MLWLLLPLMTGLAAAHSEVLSVAAPWLIAGAAGALVIAAVGRVRPWVWGPAFVVMGFVGGAAFYGLTARQLAQWDSLAPRETHLTLEVDRRFGLHAGARSVSGLGTITEPPKNHPELIRQQVYFSIAYRKGDPLPMRSEVLALSGVLKPIPRSASVATFEGFLLNAGIHFQLSRGRKLSQVQPATSYRRFCEQALGRLSGILDRGLARHPDLSVIYRGMVLGEVADLTPEQNQWFRESGTMHLFSISGLHIAAIAVALHMLLGLFRLPRWLGLAVNLALLWLYVDITGGSPSAVRSFVMVALLELAFVLRRAVNPVATLAFAALVSLLANPMQLFGASFQMSYGIVAALLLLGLPLAECWQEKGVLFQDLPKVAWAPWQHGLSWLQRTLVSALGIGVATSLVSGVAGVLYFQLLTPGALIVNLVLIPASSLALWSGFLSLLCGLLGLSGLSVVFNFAAALVLLAMERGIQLFLTLPGVYAAAHFRSAAVGNTALVGLLVTLLLGYAGGWQRRYGRWWPPFVWFVLVLAVGIQWGPAP